ncbi:transporter [Vibrio sp. HA2012]|uniref:ComEA family DNA-binding protein n=1 Tax=Vibrio sp. HA2012 TaxID=1971595 RepID=UPI000C2B8212|nr:ComEA family DNA-binding protein [Vibrio sp. HA2012]PJC85386.1 transporter [Vibrio sp. HA2012]
MKYLKLLLATLLACSFSCTVLAETASGETKTDSSTHEGIRITVNINTAPAEELSTLLLGIGLKKAQSIVDYRTENGPFKSADELQKVKGIGSATIEKNRERILL